MSPENRDGSSGHRLVSPEYRDKSSECRLGRRKTATHLQYVAHVLGSDRHGSLALTEEVCVYDVRK